MILFGLVVYRFQPGQVVGIVQRTRGALDWFACAPLLCAPSSPGSLAGGPNLLVPFYTEILNGGKQR